MIQFANNLWVGNSFDGECGDVECVLNVAKDLHIKRGWPIIEYAQVGLMDGPGNLLSAYHAAVLALSVLMSTNKRVLVHCHEGRSRSVSVVMMYLNVKADIEWNVMLELLCERTGIDLPEPNIAHKIAFNKMDWTLLRKVIET